MNQFIRLSMSRLARALKRAALLAGALALLEIPGCSPAWGELTGRQVMEKVADRPKGKDFSASIRMEFYDKKERHLKTLVASNIVEIDGIWIAKAVTVENVQTGHKTFWTISGIRFNTGLDDRIFTQRSLEAP